MVKYNLKAFGSGLESEKKKNINWKTKKPPL
jgi:hypothetical protein